MTRTAAFTLLLAAVCLVVGVALYSPRAAVLVTSLVLLAAGVGQLDVKGRS